MRTQYTLRNRVVFNTAETQSNVSIANKDVMPNLEQDPTQFIQNKNTRKRKRNVIDAEVNNAQQQPDLQQKRQERIKIPQMVNEVRIVFIFTNYSSCLMMSDNF